MVLQDVPDLKNFPPRSGGKFLLLKDKTVNPHKCLPFSTFFSPPPCPPSRDALARTVTGEWLRVAGVVVCEEIAGEE